MAICYRNLEFFFRKMHLLSRFGKSLHLLFCSIFFAVENTLSDGVVDAGIAKYFLASLKRCFMTFPPRQRIIFAKVYFHLLQVSLHLIIYVVIKSMNRFLYIGLASLFDIAIALITLT